MPKICKLKVMDILDIVGRMGTSNKDEATLQANKSYVKFRDNYKRIDGRCCVELIYKLYYLSFYEECVLWCKKYIETCLKVRDVKALKVRHEFWHIMMRCYSGLGEFEKALTYGERALSCNMYTDREEKVHHFEALMQILFMMDRHDELMRRQKGLLEVVKDQFDNSEISEFVLLRAYEEEIKMHIILKQDFDGALKCFSKIKLYRLYHIDAVEVMYSIEDNGLCWFLPLNEMFSIGGYSDEYVVETFRKFINDHFRSYERQLAFLENVHNFLLVARLM